MVKSTKEYKREKVNLLISQIKRKKEFSNINDEFIEKLIVNKVDEKDLVKISNHSKPEKSKEFKQSIKTIRKILHDIYGVFNIDENRSKLLNELEKESKNTNNINDNLKKIHINILKTHKSTNERLPFYDEIYQKVFHELKPKTILDLSSGLNPLSYHFMNLDGVKYIATEFVDEDTKFLNKYFSIMKKFNFDGEALTLNLLEIKDLPSSDICFLFKTLDSLETLKKDITKEILNKINSKIIVISFPTTTLSGRKISKKRLIWFDRLIKEYFTFEIKNEIFYIINKTNL
ncbi:MAG: hypothetical protein QGF74_02500 [Candidatus Nanoarchaeia archaeon]|nr:hypothetical protein [Candidatus Nanoarchaeia archaeon]